MTRKLAAAAIPLCLLFVLCLGVAATRGAAAADLKAGEALLKKNCGACHAIGRADASPDKAAPAFRVLGKRYPVEQLEETLGEGVMTGHPDMPEYTFDADEVGAIIAYLKSIQQR
jgi:mono/diheme cytochrome c family protein